MFYQRERRQKFKNVIKRTKQQWEFPQKKRTKRNFVNNAGRFKKESAGPEEIAYLQVQKNMNWTTEIKIKLINIDDDKRNKGREFMKRFKEKLDIKASVNIHKLRNNASRFQK